MLEALSPTPASWAGGSDLLGWNCFHIVLEALSPTPASWVGGFDHFDDGGEFDETIGVLMCQQKK